MHRTRTAPPCRCGHGHDAHEHYRRDGTCALCTGTSCAHFRAAHPLASWWDRLVGARVDEAPAPAPVPARPHLYLVR